MNYRQYMESEAWKEKRQAKLDACSGKCECEGGCTREATQIHHLHYDSLGNESLDDLQALCPKCHMQKSKVRNFYGNIHYTCCLKEGEQSPEKILPYHVWNEANFHYQMATGQSWNHEGRNPRTKEDYDRIALELETDPVILALLDNLGIMQACDDVDVCDAVTEAIGRFVDIVPEHEDYPDDVRYHIKPEFQKFFPREKY